MNDERFQHEWLMRYRCPWCVKHGNPRKCGKHVAEKHEGYRCYGFRSDIEKTAIAAIAKGDE